MIYSPWLDNLDPRIVETTSAAQIKRVEGPGRSPDA
jgi:hypothetical protein